MDINQVAKMIADRATGKDTNTPKPISTKKNSSKKKG